MRILAAGCPVLPLAARPSLLTGGLLPRGLLLGSFLLASFSLAGCSPDPEQPNAAPGGRRDGGRGHPVVLIGVDGLEWSVLRPLLRAGRLPNLARLVEGGASGYLSTIKPSFSPSIWTSVATGRRPEDHGIVHFLAADQRPFTSADRRTKALWNIASDYGREVLCVGWWMSWPAEEVHGEMIAPYSAAGQDQQRWKGNLHPKSELPNQTWPRELIDEIEPIARALANDHERSVREERLFGDAALAATGLEAALVAQTRWSLAADETFLAVAIDRLEKRAATGRLPPDLTMVYFGAPDVASHRFWGFAHPSSFRFPIPKASIEAFGGVVDAFYEDADRRVGALLAALPQDVNVIVCSDHGFHAYSIDAPSALGLTGHHLDGPPGVIIAHGPDVRRGDGGADAVAEDAAPRALGRIYEVAPLVLHLLGVPSAKDMMAPDGGALMKNVFSREGGRPLQIAQVASHDEGFRPPLEASAKNGVAAEALREWMGQLGYMEGVGEEIEFVEVLPDR